MIKFIHTADWQLGRRFERFAGDRGAALRMERMRTVERIAALAKEREVDAVLVAGDVFDLNTVHDDTIRRLLHVLERSEVIWVLLPGNHDAATPESVWSRMERMGPPPQVVLATEASPIELPGGELVVLPAPLHRRHDTRDLTEWWDSYQTPSQSIRVGLAHGAVENRLPEGSESKNPISDRRAELARLDYLALGDWHGMLEIADRTYYAGTPEPDRYRDNDAGQVLVVEIEEPGATPSVEPVSVGWFRWTTLAYSLHETSDIEALDAELERLDWPRERTLLSLRLDGTLDLESEHQLRTLIERLRGEFHHVAVDDGQLHPKPSKADLRQLGRIGFVGRAIEDLLAIQKDASHEDHADADRALSILFRHHRVIADAMESVVHQEAE